MSRDSSHKTPALSVTVTVVSFPSRWNPYRLAVYVFEWIIRITMLLLTRRFTGKTLPAIDITIHCILAVRILQAVNTI